jgi:hypothetical protein
VRFRNVELTSSNAVQMKARAQYTCSVVATRIRALAHCSGLWRYPGSPPRRLDRISQRLPIKPPLNTIACALGAAHCTNVHENKIVKMETSQASCTTDAQHVPYLRASRIRCSSRSYISVHTGWEDSSPAHPPARTHARTHARTGHVQWASQGHQ